MATNAPSAPDVTVGQPSLAKDLGEQYEKFYGAQVVSAHVERVGDAADSGRPIAQFLILPKGREVVSLKKYFDEVRTEPERRRGTATLGDLASFVAHVNRFKDGDSAVFANPDRAQPSLTAVLDYHAAGPIASAAPRFGTHRAHYAFPLADEWKAWRAAEGRPMAQGDFAEFLDARIADVYTASELPESLREWAALVGGRFATAAQLLALSRNCAVNVDTAVKQAVTLETGEVSVVFSEQHTDGAGAPVRVPNLFLLAIPVFRGGDRFTVPVRLRYRVAGGRLQWSYALSRAEAVFDQAFGEAVERVRVDTELPVFVGAPERE